MTLSVFQAVGRIARELGALEPEELAQGIDRALAALASALDLEEAVVATLSRDRRHIVIEHQLRTKTGLGRSMAVASAGSLTRELLAGNAVVVESVARVAANEAERAEALALSLESMLAVPVSHRGEAIALLVVGTVTHERRFLPGEVDAVQLLSDVLAGAFARRRAGSDWSKLADCLRGFGTDSRANIDRLTSLAGEILGGDAALYNRLSEGHLCTWGRWCAPADLPERDAPKGHICNGVIEAGSPEVVVIRDLPATAWAGTDPNVMRYGLQTYVGRAIELDDREFVGSLCVVFGRDAQPSREELRLFSAIADAVAVEERRKRAQEAQARVVAILEATLEATADGIHIADMNGRSHHYNSRYHEIWKTPEELQDDPAEAFRHRLGLVRDPVAMGLRVLELMEHPELADHEILALNDGRVIERYSRPLMVEGTCQGRVWGLRDISDRELAAAERNLLATAVDQAGEAVLITDQKGVIRYVNPAFERMTGWSASALREQTPRVLKSGEHEDAVYRSLWATIMSGETWSGVLINRRADGALIKTAEVIAPVRAKDGSISDFVAILRDVTREEQLEEQVRQAQKMEAVGRLAGGIAHDFNNLLTAIIGSVDLMTTAADMPQVGAFGEELGEIRHSAERAASLTRQLLAFSRRQVLQPRVLDLGSVVLGMEKMLRRLIPESVRIETAALGRAAWVTADPGQIEQVVLNLALNARDALPRGGRIGIEVVTTTLAETTQIGDDAMPAGRYVLLAVGDDGEGMEKGTLEHIFEPFFTTKERGKGTGLGLATVYGIVRQSGGAIGVTSEKGKGTRFSIWFPQTEADGQPAAVESPAVATATQRRTILIAEDEAGVRKVSARVLRAAGYEVLEAADGREALTFAERHGGALDALVTDVVMPHVSGPELARRILASRPSLVVLFTSGHVDTGEEIPPNAAFLPKPFTPAALRHEVESLLRRV